MRRIVHDHPFSLSVAVMLMIFLPALIRVEYIADQSHKAAETAKGVADRNQQVVSCLTAWAFTLTESLEARDAVNRGSRDVQSDLWQTIEKYLDPPPGKPLRPVIKAISQFQRELVALNTSALVNDYPGIDVCLEKPVETRAALIAAWVAGAYREGRTERGGP